MVLDVSMPGKPAVVTVRVNKPASLIWRESPDGNLLPWACRDNVNDLRFLGSYRTPMLLSLNLFLFLRMAIAVESLSFFLE
jgi:hypothetical protein